MVNQKKQVLIYTLRKENERGVGLILANDMNQLHKENYHHHGKPEC